MGFWLASSKCRYSHLILCWSSKAALSPNLQLLGLITHWPPSTLGESSCLVICESSGQRLPSQSCVYDHSQKRAVLSPEGASHTETELHCELWRLCSPYACLQGALCGVWLDLVQAVTAQPPFPSSSLHCVTHLFWATSRCAVTESFLTARLGAFPPRGDSRLDCGPCLLALAVTTVCVGRVLSIFPVIFSHSLHSPLPGYHLAKSHWF